MSLKSKNRSILLSLYFMTVTVLYFFVRYVKGIKTKQDLLCSENCSNLMETNNIFCSCFSTAMSFFMNVRSSLGISLFILGILFLLFKKMRWIGICMLFCFLSILLDGLWFAPVIAIIPILLSLISYQTNSLTKEELKKYLLIWFLVVYGVACPYFGSFL